MKEYFKMLASSMVVLILCVVILNFLGNLVERKESRIKYRDFFEQNEDFDILFLGSSHMISGVYPMELWDDYGIVSYNLGGHGSRIPTSYIVLKQALDYTTPQLVVVDCCNVKSDRMYSDSIEQAHLSLDAFPLTWHKVRDIHELIGDRKLESEFLWNFVIYHNRWDSLTLQDLEPEISVEKGAESRIGVAVPNEFPIVSQDNKMEEDTVGIAYLRKTIELCQENDIDVLLTFIPFPADKDNQRDANRIYDIAEEYGVNYINFLADVDVVDYEVDCLDEASHLNPSGGKKVTEYIGKYISEHYDIPDRRSFTEYSFWEDDYQNYLDYKISLLKNQNSLACYLMLLYDNDLACQIAVDEDSNIIMDEQIQRLIDNTGAEYILSDLEEDIDISIRVFYNNEIVDTGLFLDKYRVGN